MKKSYSARNNVKFSDETTVRRLRNRIQIASEISEFVITENLGFSYTVQYCYKI